jgi:hypothetical protein
MSVITPGDLEIRIIGRLLNPLGVLDDLPDQLLTGAGEVAKALYWGGRNEAPTDEPMSQEIGEPHGVVDITLATGDSPHMGGVGQDQREGSSSTCQTGFQ